MSQTDNLLARKEAGVGFVIFNNPERHNAVSLEMWEARRAFSPSSRSTMRCGWWC